LLRREETIMELLNLKPTQLEVLATALEHGGRTVGDARTLAALRRRKLVTDADTITELGRYQVRWYADDCAAKWIIEVNTWHQYVKRGTAPAPAARGVFGSSVERPWWRPRDVVNFERPGPGHRKGVRERELDMVTIVRQFKSGEHSIRALARAHGVAAATLSARLEELGVKPETTATREQRNARMAGNNPTVFP
jgi:hypothetical protein